MCLDREGQSFQPFQTLVQRYESQVYQFCVRYLRNKELAEDITQESFLKAYNHLCKLDKPNNFKAWLIRIAANKCTDHYRKYKRRAEIEVQVKKELKIHVVSSDDRDSDDRIEKLKKAIDQLKNNDKEIIILHYFSELSVKEIAYDLSISESAVKMRLSRSREKLARNMEQKVTDKDNGSSYIERKS